MDHRGPNIYTKAMAGSQMKGVSRKARKAITLGKSKSVTTPSSLKVDVRTREGRNPQMGPGCQCRRRAVHILGGPLPQHQCIACLPRHV